LVVERSFCRLLTMNRREFVIAAGALFGSLSLVSLATVSAQPAATGSVTAPTSQPIEGSSYTQADPKSAIYNYNVAMRGGDVEAMTALMHASTVEQRKAVQVMAVADGQIGLMLAAVDKKFGAVAAEQAAVAIGDRSNVQLAEAAVAVDGDNAQINFSAGGQSVRRVDGVWKLDVEPMVAKVDLDLLEVQLTKSSSLARVVKDELEAGLYPTAAAVVKRIEDANR